MSYLDRKPEKVKNSKKVQEVIDAETLERMRVNVRIDVSKNNPYSKYAQEQALENLFVAQAITFEEYVEALDDDAAVPKAKLKDIIDKRQIQLEESTGIINQMSGGAPDEMSTMPNGNVY